MGYRNGNGGHELEEEAVPSSSNILIFASISLLLLTFFIVLSAFALRDGKKVRATVTSLSGRFGATAATRPRLGRTNAAIVPIRAVPQTGTAEDQKIEDLLASLSASGSGVIARRVPGALVIEITDSALLPSASGEIGSAAEPLLRGLLEVIRNTRGLVVITGHAGDRPTRSATHLRLSAHLAVDLFAHLRDQPGVEPSRFRLGVAGRVAQAKGPVASASTSPSIGRAAERSVSLTIEVANG